MAKAFSEGKFETVFPFMSEDIKWNIIGNRVLNGKESVISFCGETQKYFSEVKTVFKTSNIISDKECVAIDGTAEFTDKEGKTTCVSACDVYRFENEKLKEITSYCIVTKKD